MLDRTAFVPRTVVGALFALATLVAGSAHAQGQLDTGFSSDGRTEVYFDYAGSFLDRGRAIAALPDGGVVVAGGVEAGGAGQHEFGVARITAGGSVAWRTHVDFGGTDDQAAAVIVQPDGRIVVAGWTNAGGDYDVAVARLTELGALDTDFSDDGRVTFGFDWPTAGTDRAYAVAFDPASGGSGPPRILVGGNFEYDDGAGWSETEMGVLRLTASGTVDTTYGGVGTGLARFMVYGNDSGADTHLTALATLVDGRPFLCGYTQVGGQTAGVAMLLATDGGDTWPFWGNDGEALVAIYLGFQPDACLWDEYTQSLTLAGKGLTSDGLGFDMMFARLDNTGALDTGWGAGGTSVVAFNGGGAAYDAATGLARQSDGKLLASGSVQMSATAYDFAVVRLLPSGARDSAFGPNFGVSRIGFDRGQGDDDQAAGIALAPSGRIYAVGTIDRALPGDRDFGIAALVNDLVFADGFERSSFAAWSSWTQP